MKQTITLLLFLLLTGNLVLAQNKTVITKAEELPKHSYVVKNKNAVEIIKNKETILDLASKVKKDLLADLEKFDIQENATLRNYYSNLRVISIIEGDTKSALSYIQKQRKLAEKESEKIMTGIQSEVFINALTSVNTMEAEILGPQITKSLEENLSIYDFKIIQEDVESAKGHTEILSENILIGMVQSQVQPALDNNKDEVPGDLVSALINLYYSLNFYIPYNEYYLKAYTDVLAENIEQVEKINIWKDSDIEIKDESTNAPVLIGIWDTGIDMPVFPKSTQWVNKKEKFNGKDTDGNGFVDDVYGIAYDLDGKKDPNYLEPTANNCKDIKSYQKYLKGFMDLQANINSEEALMLKKYLSGLKPEDVNGFLEHLNMYAGYAHGTHVAGIAVAGNEMAKVISARFTADYKNIPTPPNDEDVANFVQSHYDIIKYFKDNKVQVVNMSWGDSYESTLASLEVNGIGENDLERKTLAKRYYDTLYNSFKAAIESAPEILFICAAGNSNDDVDFNADYPSSINLPNLITVGAVDIEGKKTSFTTEGKSVDVYANGYEVESYVPGGDRVAFSGTSMASPNVTNLAGKILAVNPKLKPEEVIDIILKTSTKSEEDENVLLINPKKAIELASK